jgi:TonB family protein
MQAYETALGLLPERSLNWRSLLTSYALQILAVLFLINLGILMPGTLTTLDPSIAEVIQLMDVPKPRRAAFKPPPKLVPAPEPAETPLIEGPRLVADFHIARPAPTPDRNGAEDTPAPALRAPELSRVLSAEPARQVRVVHTGAAFSPGENPPANRAPRPARGPTGDLGDPFGAPGTGKPKAHSLLRSQGGPDAGFGFSPGPGHGGGLWDRRGAPSLAGGEFDHGTRRGGNAPDGPGGSKSRAPVMLAEAAFNPPAEVKPAPAPLPETPATTPVHILYKPSPSYTDEARQLRLEGEVLLEVEFLTSGECRVVRVLRGLGHGLDEAAQRAAGQIRFQPATSNGRPVDQTATIRVVFQLAY